jgi:hypothetical protein
VQEVVAQVKLEMTEIVLVQVVAVMVLQLKLLIHLLLTQVAEAVVKMQDQVHTHLVQEEQVAAAQVVKVGRVKADMVVLILAVVLVAVQVQV